MYKDHIASNSENHIKVFTDASVQGGKVGVAVWSVDWSSQCRMQESTAIFTAELQALYMAIQHISMLTLEKIYHVYGLTEFIASHWEQLY